MDSDNTHQFAVLFVDDEEKTRKYFRLAYEQNFPILLASNVQDALEIVSQEAHRIGVLISDQRMPGALGVELLSQVRDEHPSIVRILTTAYSELEPAIEAVNRGEIHRYITKPWDIQALGVELQQAMNLFLLLRERNFLLEEKLSFMHRKHVADRIRDLAIGTAPLPMTHHRDKALESYVQLHLNALSGSTDKDTSLDLWNQTLKESSFSVSLIATCAHDLQTLPPEPKEEASDLAYIGKALNIAVEGSNTPLKTRNGFSTCLSTIFQGMNIKPNLENNFAGPEIVFTYPSVELKAEQLGHLLALHLLAGDMHTKISSSDGFLHLPLKDWMIDDDEQDPNWLERALSLVEEMPT